MNDRELEKSLVGRNEHTRTQTRQQRNQNLPRAVGQKHFRRALAVVSAVRA
jgi:hypothetical protein